MAASTAMPRSRVTNSNFDKGDSMAMTAGNDDELKKLRTLKEALSAFAK